MAESLAEPVVNFSPPEVALAGSLDVTTKETAPIPGQKPGTNGLRKKTRTFMEGHYLPNYVQCVFNACIDFGTPVEGRTLVVSGDGRYFNKAAIQIIIKMAFANGVKRVWCGTNGLLSTPATSAVIRYRGSGFEPCGGFICTASHNPGGIDEDFGIKYNCENGGPAPEKMTDLMVPHAETITKFFVCEGVPDIDLSQPAIYTIGDRIVEVFDCVEDHMKNLQGCFDFAQIKRLLARDDWSMCYDSMCGVQGPYAKRILEEELGAAPGSCINAEPMEDFGGKDTEWKGHADPNLEYAVILLRTMGVNAKGAKIETPTPPPVFGAAADGDADRNMIMGSNFFVSPCDSLAILVANSSLIPQFNPQFGRAPLKGCARSLPTSSAVDRVAAKMKLDLFEVPVGWKFFGNLMDSGTSYFPDKPTYTPFISGEESFGAGSDALREKDGMWAVLAWLQIIAAKTEAKGSLVTPEEITTDHWKEYGRNYYASYHYEDVNKEKAKEMMARMVANAPDMADATLGGMEVKFADMFDYHDPVDDSISRNQGVRIIFKDGSRIIFRISGTAVGATIRLYLEKYEGSDGQLDMDPFEVVKPLAAIAFEVSKLPEYTGRNEPTVIT